MSGLITKVKPSSEYIDLHTATHLVLKTMFPVEWEANEFTHLSPFRVKKSEHKSTDEIDNTNINRKLIRYKMSTKKGIKKPCHYKVTSTINVLQYEKEKEAVKCFSKAWKKIRPKFINGKLPITARSIDDDSDKLYSNSDIVDGVWMNRSRSIFYSGYIKIHLKDKSVWGIIHIKKSDVSDLCKKLENQRKKKLNKIHRHYTDTDIEILRSYMKRLSEFLISKNHSTEFEKKLYVFVNKKECIAFIDNCAKMMGLKWRKSADFYEHFQNYPQGTDTNSFLNKYGIAKNGSPPNKPKKMPKTEEMINEVLAEIRKRISQNPHNELKYNY